jgi:hypothetical protein
MKLPFDEWTILPAAIVLAAAFTSRRSSRVAAPRGAVALLGSPWAPLVVAVPLFLGMLVFEGRAQPIPLLFAVLFGLVGRADPVPAPRQAGPQGERRLGMPALIGVASAALTAWVWSGGGFTPRFHDESAYLLQGEIFAHGRWTEPSPPHPEFFEQFHVLVVPRRAAKYPPGHALMLAPGVALGAPPAIPLLLTAGTGALLFVLIRRVAGSLAALLAWLVWVGAPGGLQDRTSYFSELTTGFLWLAVWWAVWRWLESGGRGWLAAAGFGISFGLITRPLTMLLFALPVVVAVSVRAVRRRTYRDLAAAAAAGLLPLLLLPVWATRTTGDWAASPLSLYTRAYMPFDRPGFGAHPRPPQRAVPAAMQELNPLFRRIHRQHTPALLPGALRDRAAAVLRGVFGGGLGLLIPFFFLGLTLLSREGAFAAVTALLLLVGYLAYAHMASWTIYYLETQAVLAAAAGIGLDRAIGRVPPRIGRTAVALAIVGLAVAGAFSAAAARLGEARSSGRLARLEVALGALAPQEPSIVFIRPAPGASPHESLVQNPAALDRARVWLVHDLGKANERLRQAAPDRTAYLYDETRGRVIRFPPNASSPSAGSPGPLQSPSS